MTAVRRSLLLSALESYFALVLQIASTVITARLLTPADIGVFAVAAVFAALASTFRDFGVAEYLIQEKELNNDTVRASLSVNIAVSWLMAVALFVLAPIASSFYDSSGVGEVMRVQSLSFILIPFGAVTMAWFRREMTFTPILVAGILSSISSFLVVIGLAVGGFGFMSLAWGSLAGVLVTVSTSIYYRPPGFPTWPGFRGVSRVLHFGKHVGAIYVVGQIGKGAPEMIIGRAIDLPTVGIFSRAYGLVEIFNRLVIRAVIPVCLPYFAKGVRETGTVLPGIRISLSLLTVIGWPFLGFMGITAYSVVRIMYGDQWIEAVRLSQVLCAVAALELLYATSKEALLAVGKPRESNGLQMSVQGLRILGLAGVIPFGIDGACWGMLISAGVCTIVVYRSLHRHLDLQLADVFRSVLPSLFITAFALFLPMAWTLLWPIDEQNYVRSFAACATMALVMWPLGLRLLGHPLWVELKGGVSNLVPRLKRRH